MSTIPAGHARVGGDMLPVAGIIEAGHGSNSYLVEFGSGTDRHRTWVFGADIDGALVGAFHARPTKRRRRATEKGVGQGRTVQPREPARLPMARKRKRPRRSQLPEEKAHHLRTMENQRKAKKRQRVAEEKKALVGIRFLAAPARADMDQKREGHIDSEAAEVTQWPRIIPDQIKKTCLADFMKATSLATAKEFACAVCGELHPVDRRKRHRYPKEKVHGLSLLSIRLQHQEAERSSSSDPILAQSTAAHWTHDRDNVNVCRNRIPARALANHLWIEPPPPELRDLTVTEEMALSLNRSRIRIVQLIAVAGPGTGQHAVKGNVMTAPQDIVTLAKKLPIPIPDLAGMIKVIFVGSGKPTAKQLMNVLGMRRDKVASGLRWLRSHNPEYHQIPIDEGSLDTIPACEEPLIPPELLATVAVVPPARHPEGQGYSGSDFMSEESKQSGELAPDDVVLRASGLLDMNTVRVSMDEAKRSATERLLGESSRARSDAGSADSADANAMAPQQSMLQQQPPRSAAATNTTLVISHGSELVNEYNNPAYWTHSFPTLFPHGIGGAEDPSRRVPLSLRAWGQHLLSLARPEFRVHHSFMFIMANVMHRREVAQHSKMLMQSHGFADTAVRLKSIKSSTLEAALKRVQQQGAAGVSASLSRDPNPAVATLFKQLTTVGSKVHTALSFAAALALPPAPVRASCLFFLFRDWR